MDARTRAARTAGAAALCGLLGVLAACGGQGAAATGELTATVLDPPFEVSATPLEDTAGQPFSLAGDTDKDLTLVFFGYTNCPDICGQVMATLTGTLARLDDAERERLDVVFVTTDAPRDTPEVVERYVDRFDPSIIGLTGRMDDIIEVGQSLAVGIDRGEKLPGGGYDVTHGTRVYGIDRADEAPVMWDQDVSQAQLTRDVLTLLDEG